MPAVAEKTRLNLNISADIEKAKFPASVPVLSADNFCKGESQRGAKMCLSARLTKVFAEKNIGGDNPYAALNILDNVMKAVIKKEIAGNPKFKGIPADSVISFNDSSKTTTADAARVWNKTMAAAGYVVGNPAARTIETIPALA